MTCPRAWSGEAPRRYVWGVESPRDGPPPAGTPPGTYRLGVVGAARGFRRWVSGKNIAVYRGYSSPFEVVEAKDEEEEEKEEETRAEVEVDVEAEDERRAGETVVYRFA